jgi:hypothetical protein
VDEMSGMHWKIWKCIQNFIWKTFKKTDFDDLGADGRIILKLTLYNM